MLQEIARVLTSVAESEDQTTVIVDGQYGEWTVDEILSYVLPVLDGLKTAYSVEKIGLMTVIKTYY